MLRLIPLALLALALAACGAAPGATAPTAVGATGTAIATAAPAPTAAPSASPTASPIGVTPEETAVPEKTEATAAPTARPSLSSRPTPDVAPLPETPSPAPLVGEVPADLLAKIVADAAQRSGVNAASIVVQRGEAVEWNDSSLGCAKPGMAYMQMITPGYRVVLQAGQNGYDYRANTRGYFFVCE